MASGGSLTKEQLRSTSVGTPLSDGTPTITVGGEQWNGVLCAPEEGYSTVSVAMPIAEAERLLDAAEADELIAMNTADNFRKIWADPQRNDPTRMAIINIGTDTAPQYFEVFAMDARQWPAVVASAEGGVIERMDVLNIQEPEREREERLRGKFELGSLGGNWQRPREPETGRHRGSRLRDLFTAAGLGEAPAIVPDTAFGGPDVLSSFESNAPTDSFGFRWRVELSTGEEAWWAAVAAAASSGAVTGIHSFDLDARVKQLLQQAAAGRYATIASRLVNDNEQALVDAAVERVGPYQGQTDWQRDQYNVALLTELGSTPEGDALLTKLGDRARVVDRKDYNALLEAESPLLGTATLERSRNQIGL